MIRAPGARAPRPSTGPVAGPVSGIDRGLIAMLNPERHKPRQSFDPASVYSGYDSQFPHIIDERDRPALQPHSSYAYMIAPAMYEARNPTDVLCTRHAQTCINKIKTPISTVAYRPDGSQIINGNAAADVTLWFGDTYNFNTIIPHCTNNGKGIRSIRYTSSGEYFVVGDDGGEVKYWQPSMSANMVINAHGKDAPGTPQGVSTVGDVVTSLSIAPSDLKFATSSNDGTAKVFDFWGCVCEKTLTGHNSGVTDVAWHPHKALIATSGKDSMVKIWDAKEGKELRNLNAHTSWVNCVEWNQNGWWLLSGGKDNMLRIFDIRTMKHFHASSTDHKGVMSMSWHPFNERYFVTGSNDGCIQHWLAGQEFPQAEVLRGHDQTVTDFAWHPAGTCLVSVSMDFSTKVWVRSVPGDGTQQYSYEGNPRRLQAALAAAQAAGVPVDETLGKTSIGSAVLPPSLLGVIGGQTAITVAHDAAATRAQTAMLMSSIDGSSGGGGGGGGGGSSAGGGGAGAGSSGQQKAPGPGYICRKCNIPGHWLAACPQGGVSRPQGPPRPPGLTMTMNDQSGQMSRQQY